MYPLLDSYFKTIKRFLPTKSEGTSVGIDIGLTDCKMIEIAKTDDSYELISLAVEPIIKGDIKAAVTQLLGKCKNKTKLLYTAVFGKGTLIRYVKMPRMTEKDLKSSFNLESDKYFPFASDQIYTDCYILDPQGKDKQMSVLATAVRREIIDKRIELLKDLGVDVDFIGINPIVLANALNVLGPKDEAETDKVVALLDLGDSVSNLNILVDGTPRFTRDIFVGGKDFTIRISNALGVDVTEAEKLKKNPGDRLEDVVNACESTVMNIVEELMLSFDFFMTEQNMEIKKLYLTGGGSQLNAIQEAFEKHLDVAIEKWNPLVSLKLSDSVKKEDGESKSLQFGVAVGLALYQYD